MWVWHLQHWGIALLEWKVEMHRLTKAGSQALAVFGLPHMEIIGAAGSSMFARLSAPLNPLTCQSGLD